MKMDEVNSEEYSMIDPDNDKEVRTEVNVNKTEVLSENRHLGSDRFQRFSSWKLLVKAIAFLQSRIRNVQQAQHSKNVSTEGEHVKLSKEAELFIIREVQHDNFKE